MKRLTSLLLTLLISSSLFGQEVVNSGILGGIPNPLRHTPSLWLDSSQQYCYTDAAIQFNAADKSWLQITDAAQTGLDPGADDVLCMGWFRVDSLTATRFIFDKRNTSSMQACTLHITTAGAVVGRIADGTSVSATSAGGAVAINTWYFIAYLADRSGNLDIYLGTEGVAPAVVATVDISAKVASDINSDGAFRVGTNNINDDYFDGRIDSLMFFKAADLSAVASDIIAWAYNSGAGRLCSEITTAQKTAWGAISGWELGENSGRRYDSWGPNHLDQAFAELVTNGTFTGNSTGWNEGVGWAYGTNNEAATAAEADLAQTTVAPTVGKLYSTSFTAAVTSGTLRLNLGGVNGTTRSTSATHTETMRATSTASLVIDPVAAYTGTVDAVSVMAAEILPAPGIVRGLSRDSNFATALNGTSQYYSYTGTAFDPGTGDFSVFGAFYVSAMPETGIGATIYAAGGGAANQPYYVLYMNKNGTLTTNFNDGSATSVSETSTNAVSVGNWYTFASNYDRDENLVVYINGTAWITVAISTRANACNPGTLYWGRLKHTDLYYHKGLLDNCGQANRLLTADEITFLHNNGEWRQWAELGVAGTDGADLTSAVVKGFWEFDNKASLGLDSTANANHLTPQNSPTQGQGINYLEGVISYWDDRGSAGNNALMETLAKRPSYSTVGGPNNRPEIVFDGVDDYLRSTFNLNQPSTVFIVGRFSADSDVMFDGVTGDAIIWRDATSKVEIDAGTALEGPASDTANHVFSAIFNGNSSSIAVDGGTPVDGAAGAGNPGGITLGIDRDANSNPLEGAITAVVVYDTAFSAAQRTAITSYLKSLYAISP